MIENLRVKLGIDRSEEAARDLAKIASWDENRPGIPIKNYRSSRSFHETKRIIIWQKESLQQCYLENGYTGFIFTRRK